MKEKPSNTESVLTVRSAPKDIIDAADLVTDMVEVKQWYNKEFPEARHRILNDLL